jgi:hypothetical protein
MNERSRAMPEGTARSEPLRGTERLEWARIAVEEAVERIAKNPGEHVYVAAAVARWRELDEIRAGLERRQDRLRADGTIPEPKGRLELAVAAAAGKPVAPGPGITTCANCRRFVAVEGQHYTGSEWICTPANRSAAAPAPTQYRGMGRPRNTDLREG